jgi:two-component system, sensor histidine kinase and response regulator
MNNPSILYIDDEKDNLLVFKHSFKNDFQVTTAESGAQGLQIVRDRTFDIIVVDQRMPGMTGVEFFEKIQPDSQDAIRILLTGYSDMQSIVEAINLGRIYYYCSKPWKNDALKIIFLKSIEHLQIQRRNKVLVNDLSKTINELNTFLYIGSHSLKPPITSQLGLLRLQSEFSDHEIIEKIEDSIQLLEKTISKMQALSNYGYKYLDDNYEIDLQQFLNNFLEKNKQQIETVGASITITVSQPIKFLSHRSSLNTLLENILENSLKFVSNRTPKISISAVVEGSKTLKIEITDNGKGIKSETLPFVFDPFQGGSTQSIGSGLGLFLSRKICETMQGKIDIKSEVGVGTVFTIEIPVLSC